MLCIPQIGKVAIAELFVLHTVPAYGNAHNIARYTMFKKPNPTLAYSNSKLLRLIF